MQEKVFYAIVIAVVVIGGVGIGLAYYHSPAPQAPASSSSSPYQLTLVVTTNNQFNSTQQQPAFYVLSNGTLHSSAQINLPANRVINLTIINYDDGPATPLGGGSGNNSLYNVIGTEGGVMHIVNNTNANSTLSGTSGASGGINIAGGATVSSIPIGDAAHTFTILNSSNPTDVVLNLPLPISSIVHAQFVMPSGTYNWQCEAPCGTGASGWDGAMATPGWMTGTVVFS